LTSQESSTTSLLAESLKISSIEIRTTYRFEYRSELKTTFAEMKKANPRKRKFDNIFDQDDALQQEVNLFYKQFYWDRFWGDDIPVQEIGEELFDTGVNLGVRRVVRFLQEGLNLLNRNKKNYVDIVEDGLFGKNTHLKIDDVSVLLKVMNIFQGMHYIEYMRKNPVQEKYARGWLKRVKL